MMRIQEEITIRALEILEPKPNSKILDLGCGPGFTSIYLNELGYRTVALDLILEFLSFYSINELHPINADMCFLPFQPNSFDAVISISALQWIYREINNPIMHTQMKSLAKAIDLVLKPKSKGIFQFYPKNDRILKEIGQIITDYTFLNGNFIIDNPANPKRRNIFLFLQKRE